MGEAATKHRPHSQSFKTISTVEPKQRNPTIVTLPPLPPLPPPPMSTQPDWEAQSSSSSDSFSNSSSQLFNPSSLGFLSTPATISSATLPTTSGTLDSSSDDDDVFSSAPSKPHTIRTSNTSYILGDKLGDGAFASVKEAIDENTLRIVAVKTIDTRRIRKLRGGLDAVQREIAVQKRLHHDNVIELIDVVRVPNKSRLYIVLELANGCSVEELASRGDGKLPEEQVANIMAQTLAALHYMHGRGVVHRDVKPSNLMLSPNGIVKMSDFGVAEFLDEYKDDDNVSRTSGSPAFQAPEIATGEIKYSGMKVDVWALGVTTYLLLTGKVPFSSESLVGLFDVIGKGIYEEPEGVSDGGRDVIRRMLTVDWRQRAGVDELLKHSWITKAGNEKLESLRSNSSWVDIPKRESSIMAIVKRMYKNEADESSMTQMTEIQEESNVGPSCSIV